MEVFGINANETLKFGNLVQPSMPVQLAHAVIDTINISSPPFR